MPGEPGLPIQPQPEGNLRPVLKRLEGLAKRPKELGRSVRERLENIRHKEPHAALEELAKGNIEETTGLLGDNRDKDVYESDTDVSQSSPTPDHETDVPILSNSGNVDVALGELDHSRNSLARAAELHSRLLIQSPEVIGRDHLLSLLKKGGVVAAVTHFTDIDAETAIADIGRARNVGVASQKSNQRVPIAGILNRTLGGKNIYSTSEYFDFRKEFWNAVSGKGEGEHHRMFDRKDYIPMAEALARGDVIVGAAHAPAYDWKLPDKPGVGMVYLAQLQAGEEAVILPVAVDIDNKKGAFLPGVIGMSAQRLTAHARPSSRLIYGEPLRLEKIDVTNLDKDTREKLRAQGAQVMEAIAALLPEEKRGKWGNQKKELDINADQVEYGKRAGEGFRTLFDTWPIDIGGENTDNVTIRTEGRIDSPKSFWDVWDGAEKIVMNENNLDLRQEVLADQGGDEALQTTIDTVKKSLEPLILSAEDTPSSDLRGYFAPFNADWERTCVVSVDSNNQANISYKDVENVGGAKNRVLAEVAAASNFYGRLWAKPEAQQAFLTGLLSGATSAQELEKRLTIARAAASFGTIYMSKYPMGPNGNPDEYPMAKGLLANLSGNLQNLQTSYETHLATL